MNKYLVVYINKMITGSNIIYDGDNINEAYINILYSLNHCCIINTKDKMIIASNLNCKNLFIIYDNKYNIFVGVYEKEYLNRFKSDDYSIYNYKGNLIESTANSIPKEKIKKKNAIEIKGLDKLSDLDKVKTLEAYLSVLRKHGFNNAKMSDEDFKDLRFTVRKSFDENEQDYYTDLETAKSTCPPGYSVFDVLTGKCIMTNKLIKDRISEGVKYKEAWDKLKEFLEDRKNTHITCADIFYVETYQTVLNAMKDFEGEMLKNE